MSHSFENRFAHSGLKPSLEGLFNTLVDLLSNEYEPSSIWKELLQNAEDAGAHSLHFLALPALSEGHIFEQTPVLCALNDGAFSSTNAQAITEMGLGTKGADEDAIGKFGLGMKSVFNLGEVLFYFASPGQHASVEQQGEGANAPFGKMLNPHDTVRNESSPWKLNDGRTRNALMKRLLARLRTHPACSELENGPNARWFALVLPLRSRQITEGVYPLKDLFPTSESLFPNDLPARLTSFFPLLRNLQNLHVWRSQDETQAGFSAKLADDKRRAHANSQLLIAPQKVFDFGGAVVAEKARLVFEGQEIGFSREEFAETGIESGAQKQYARGEDGAAARRQNEKFTPCGAVAWFQTTQREALAIRPAVWLPLPEERDTANGKSDAFDLSIPGCSGLQLTLHGNFFIDKGRRNLILNSHDRDGETAQSKWNKKLLREATLPLVLPSLKAFLDKLPSSARPNEIQTRQITEALTKAEFWIEKSEQRTALTRGGNWIYRLSGPNNGISIGTWELEARNEFWTLPAPPEGEAAGALKNPSAKVFEWLPRLEDLCRLKTLTWEWPRLTRDEPQKWDEANILALLKASEGKNWFKSEISARYLIDLLRHLQTQEWSDKLWERCLEIGRQGLREFSFGARLKDPIVQVWREFWALVPDRFWIPLEIGTKNEREEKNPARAKEFLGKLLALGLEKLPVPTDLCPPNQGANLQLWDAVDARRVARHFADLIAHHSTLGDWVRPNHLLEAMAGELEEKYAAIGEWALFRTKEWRSDAEPTKRVARSWRELRELKAQSRLWGDARDGGRDWLRDYGLAVDLSQKNRDGNESFIVSIEEGADRPYSRTLWPRRDEQPQSFGATACLKLLLARPILREISGRAKLAPRLFDELKADATLENQRALRYLLHAQADPKRFSDENPLLKSALGAQIWLQIAQVVTPQADSWRLIDEKLSPQISDDIAGLLNIELVDKSFAHKLLQSHVDELGALPFDFSPAQRREVLLGIEDEAVFRALPFHELALENGVSLHPLPQIVYLQGEEIAIPDALRTEQNLLARLDDSRLEGAYKKWGVKPFALESLIELALCHSQPHLFTQTILETLAKLPPSFEDADLSSGLQSEKWLFVEGRAYSPSQVVKLDAILPESQEIARGWREVCVCWADVESAWASFDGLKILRSYLPDMVETARLLREALRQGKDQSQFFLGDLSLQNQLHKGLPLLLEGWAASGALVPDGVNLLHKLWSKASATQDCPWKETAWTLAPALFRPVNVEKLEGWLKNLKPSLQGVGVWEEDKPLGALAFSLFQALVRHPDCTRNEWPALLFAAADGSWRKAEELTLEGRGFEKSARLHPDWANVIQGVPRLCSRRGTSAPRKPQGDVWDVLKSEIGVWAAAPMLKAALVAVLGAEAKHDTKAEQLCADYVDAGSVFEGRSKIWSSLSGQSTNVSSDIQVARNNPFYFRFVLQEKTEETANLLGDLREFALEQTQIDSLLVGGISRNGNDGWHIKLRQMAGRPQTSDQSKMNEILSSTLRLLVAARDDLDSSYDEATWHDGQSAPVRGSYRPSRRLSERLETVCLPEWSKGEQIDLEIAQKLMLDNAFFYFCTLSGRMKPNSKARELVEKYNRWRYDDYSPIDILTLLKDGQTRSSHQTNEMTRAEIFNELRRQLEGNGPLAGETRLMVAQKIRELGYDLEAVPFELFQNADDAASELLESLAHGAPEPATLRELEVEVELPSQLSNGQIKWRHFGRKINHKGQLNALDAPTVRERGYGRDLEKMLILQASDKGTQNYTTGKFGLGFKSVFLATHKARIQSGQLSFEVLGGFYPCRVPIETMPAGATQISFAMENRADLTPMLSGLLRVLPLQLVFGRTLRACNFKLNGQLYRVAPQRKPLIEGHLDLVEWGNQPAPLLDSTNAYSPNDSAPSSLPSRALLFRAGTQGQLLVGLDEKGIVALPHDIPSIWSTTPTRVTMRPGFALAANFILDVGRVQLASCEENQRTAYQLRESLAQSFSKLEEAWKQWPSLREKLLLNSDISQSDFALSLAKVLISPENALNPLLKIIFGGSDSALRPLRNSSSCFASLPSTSVSPAPIMEDEPISFVVSDGDFEKIWRWWQLRKTKFFPTTEGELLPEGMKVYCDLGSSHLQQRRRAWLILLLRSNLESVGRTTDAQKRGFISFCTQNGDWIERFSAPNANVSQLGKSLEHFLDKDQDNHQYLHLLRHSLPLFSLMRWLDDYIQIFSNLNVRKHIRDTQVFAPRTDIGWGLQVDVPNAPQIGTVLGIGVHFFLRELYRAGVATHTDLHEFCFHPSRTLTRALEPYDSEVFSNGKKSLQRARRAYTIVSEKCPTHPTFGGDFCLPITYWAKNGANK